MPTLSLFNRVRLCKILWAVARQAPLSVGFSRQEYWSGLPCPPPGDLPDPEAEREFLMCPGLAGKFFTTSATWEAPIPLEKSYTTNILKSYRFYFYFC